MYEGHVRRIWLDPGGQEFVALGVAVSSRGETLRLPTAYVARRWATGGIYLLVVRNQRAPMRIPGPFDRGS
jgi:hypothetical protein